MPSWLQMNVTVIRKRFDFFPDICWVDSPRSGGALGVSQNLSHLRKLSLTYNPNSPDSSKFSRLPGLYFLSLWAILNLSCFTDSRFTEAASPCRRISLMLYLIIFINLISLQQQLRLTLGETFESSHHFAASHSQVHKVGPQNELVSQLTLAL